MEDDRVAKWVYDSACERAVELAGRNGTLIARLESLQSAVASYLSRPNDFTRETLTFAQINAQRTLAEVDPLPQPDAQEKPRFRPRPRRTNAVPMGVIVNQQVVDVYVEYELVPAETDVGIPAGVEIRAMWHEDNGSILDELTDRELEEAERRLYAMLREEDQ